MKGNCRRQRKMKPLSRDAECAGAANARGEKMDRNKSADDSL
jgi:uncharacterized protein YkwD